MSFEQPLFGLSATRAALFLDVDGTLLGFKDHPNDVVADPALRALLTLLHDKTAGALALISGRTIADLDRIMAPLALAAGGTHGAELRFADGHVEHTTGEALTGVYEALKAFVADHPGTMLENKGAAIAIHYRLAPGAKEEIAGLLDALVTWDDLARDDLMIQHGKLVAEVKHRASSKGGAIDTLMASPPFAGRVPVFIGDDLTDEYGFAAVNAADGVSIKVGDGETQARQRLASVDEVRAFLTALCEA